MLRSLRTFTTEVLRDLFYVVEQNGKDSWACVNHKSYFKHLTKNMFKSLFLLIIHHSTKSFLQMYYLFATVAHLCWPIESLGEDMSSQQKLCSNMWCWNILGFAHPPLRTITHNSTFVIRFLFLYSSATERGSFYCTSFLFSFLGCNWNFLVPFRAQNDLGRF